MGRQLHVELKFWRTNTVPRLQVTMKVEHQLALIIGKLDEQTKGINESNRRINDVQVSIDDLRAAKDDFERWQPKVTFAGSG